MACTDSFLMLADGILFDEQFCKGLCNKMFKFVLFGEILWDLN
jgi:hypothetical protein